MSKQTEATKRWREKFKIEDLDKYKIYLEQKAKKEKLRREDWKAKDLEGYKDYLQSNYINNRETLLVRQRKYNRDRKKEVSTPEGWAQRKVQALRRRAKVHNREFNLDINDILNIMVDNCPVLDIKLNYGYLDVKTKTAKDSPSVDRIDNTKGYIKGNVIIVSNLINFIKRDLKLNEIPEVLGKIVSFYSKYNEA